MKIFNLGLDIEPGKRKYNGGIDKLAEKFSPDKVTPYTVEFIDSDIETADVVVVTPAKKLDFVLIDLEKIEKRIPRAESETEKALLVRCQEALEKETLLCDLEFSKEEADLLKQLQLVSFKPSLVKESGSPDEELIKEALAKAGLILFFTAGKKEVHAWELARGEVILEAAGKIHSDLKRGFIKGEVTKYADRDKFFNMAEARAKGLVKQVNRDYVVESQDIIEIKFNV